ncbi:hypothetical protein [Parerythrobacter jejuensis]|uniref:Tryptophan-rich sensory protein n=1 Tax=Parerythrobacter jejuensis TaxID=795812 RepID=A0A845AQ63_9SPHN|nr:hypothetical protein [Parerythrobacter jejuensis]MXP31537.1 hypothetical protein [Parerythrobacter jejuensis]
MTALRANRSPVQIVAILLAVIIQIGATFLPQLGFGEPIGDRSDSVRTLITPSGWAFAIWGPLFLGSALFAIWQALPKQRDSELVDRIGWSAVGALSAQGLWATYTQFANLTVISAIIIAFSLMCLLAILRVMVSFERPFTAGERWIVALVFSALAAWLTAATIVNISATLVYYGVAGGFEYPLIAAAIILVGGAIAATAVARSKGNPWYSLVFLWALLAIYFRGGQESGAIAIATAVSGVAVAAACLGALRHRDNRARWFG